MSSSQSGNEVETLGPSLEKVFVVETVPPGNMDVDLKSLEPDVPLSGSDQTHAHAKKASHSKREVAKMHLPLTFKPSSSIPLPVKSPKSASSSKVPNILTRNFSRHSRPGSASLARPSQVTNKHTLEIQFINKKKRLAQLKKDLLEKQKPVLDLYQNLLQIKKRLEELGKVVQLEEVKLLPFSDSEEKPPEPTDGGGGESISPEVVMSMQTSIEEIPKTLMDICKNLLSRRAVIVDLLDSVTKSEVDVGDLSDKIETLKTEGTQLQNNLDAIINEHEKKIRELVVNWQTLLNDKKSMNTNVKISDLEDKLKAQEKLTQESNQMVLDLQRKLDERRACHERVQADLNANIHALKNHILKLEQELEIEKKATTDFKNRNNTNAQNSKLLRSKIAELETQNKNLELANAELTKKIKYAQDQVKHKETLWIKEKEDLSKNLKHQENLLQRLTADKNKFETRLEEVEGEKSTVEEQLTNDLEMVKSELYETKSKMESLTKEKEEATQRCKEMEEHIARMGVEFKETMHMVSNSVEWGKDVPGTIAEAQKYSQSLVKDIVIRECQDKIKQLEKENHFHKETIAMVENTKNAPPTETEKAVLMQHDTVAKYQQLLADSAQKLAEKSQEVSKLTSEIRQLKVRQEHLEELNLKCPTENLQKMVEEGRQKLNELMKKSMESEQKILHYENVIEKQSKQMNEMENLLRYRENMAGVLKASRDELILEKESLTRYSHEMRTVLAEVSKEGKMKDRLIKELQEKIDLRERQISKLEKEVKELESNLVMTNEKRFKLQETIGSMEKELQSTKAHVNQLADINARYDNGVQCTNNYSYESESRTIIMGRPDGPTHKNTYEITIQKNTTHPPIEVKTNVADIEYKDEVNSKSLIGLTLQKVDLLRARLNYLTTVNVEPFIEKDKSDDKPLKSSSTQTIKDSKTTQQHFSKILELTANRYELLQKQAYESYAELTNLMKLAASSHNM